MTFAIGLRKLRSPRQSPIAVGCGEASDRPCHATGRRLRSADPDRAPASIKRKMNMRAVRLTAFGDPVDGLQYVDIPEPGAPGPNQVLVGVEFSPINPNDLIRRPGRDRAGLACEPGCRSREDVRISWGTEGSNPSPSSGESAANLIPIGARLACRPRGRPAAGRLRPPGLHPAGRDCRDRISVFWHDGVGPPRHLGQLELGMESNEFRTEPVGFTRGGAVPDRDQLHPMLSGK
jgi:hypothetical protein